MTARWEPLETAEEVVAAMQAGQQVQCGEDEFGWETLEMGRPISDLIDAFSVGWKFRALIEDSK